MGRPTGNRNISWHFVVLSAAMCVCLVASNLFETKIFQLWGLTLTGGFLIFPISYILNDALTEVYGFRMARRTVLLAFAMNALVVAMAQLVRLLPGASFWEGQEHFDYIFAADLRITLASMAAFLAGSIVNALVMDRMHTRDGEKRFGVRAILSSLAGETLDSLVFFPIAFWSVGSGNLIRMMMTQIILKTLYEVVFLPVTTKVQHRLKTAEGLTGPTL